MATLVNSETPARALGRVIFSIKQLTTLESDYLEKRFIGLAKHSLMAVSGVLLMVRENLRECYLVPGRTDNRIRSPR